MYTGHHKSFLFFRIPWPSSFSFHSSKMGIYLFRKLPVFPGLLHHFLYPPPPHPERENAGLGGNDCSCSRSFSKVS